MSRSHRRLGEHPPEQPELPVYGGSPLRRETATVFFRVHSALRDDDGLHADAALDELCKLLFAKIWAERRKDATAFSAAAGADAIRSLYKEASGRALAQTRLRAPQGTLAEPLRVSDGALVRAVRLLQGIDLSSSPVDLKGIAFQQVIAAAARFGMGQYFTPEAVITAAVEILAPRRGERLLDPFCGSGRFLTEAAFFARRQSGGTEGEFHGIEKSERMIRVALTDALLHDDIPLTFHHTDSLQVRPTDKALPLDSFDMVLTNPPFGSLISDVSHLRDTLVLARHADVVPLEVLGLERALRFLRPGGRLAIVLPDNVLTTRQTQYVRDFVMSNADVLGVLSLPPQTFAPFAGVAKASLLFLRRRTSSRPEGKTAVVAVAEHVGYDNTNRPVTANDLPQIAGLFGRALANRPLAKHQSIARIERNMLGENLSAVAALGVAQSSNEPWVRLGELCEAMFTGRTPPRSGYTPSGIRILKVGDLTGEGIDWSPGNRSFVGLEVFRRTNQHVQRGDILFTASAHHPSYIGQKVDIVDAVPDQYAPGLLCVAEVMCIRPRTDVVDPMALLFWLRSAGGYRAIQACVVGQSAHIYPDRVAGVRVPKRLLAVSFKAVSDSYRRALELRRQCKEELAQAERLFEEIWKR